MNAGRNRFVSVAASVAALTAFAAAMTAVACGVDGTTPDCSLPDSGCGTLMDGAMTVPQGDDAASDAPADIGNDVAVEGASDARVDSGANAADARPRDARADG